MTGPDTDLEACRERALMLLGQRPHSVAELRRKLLRKGFTRSSADEIIEDFLRVGLLDDAQFAEAFCRQRLTGSRPAGRIRLRAELRKRGVAEPTAQDAISAALADFGEGGEYGLALEAGRTKWQQVARRDSDDPFKMKQKVCRFLAGRGFTSDICRRVVDRLEQESADSDERSTASGLIGL